MNNMTGRMPTRGIQNPVPTKVEMMSYDGSTGRWQSVKTDALNHFATCDIDKSTDELFYEGLEESEGNWQLVRTIKTNDVTSMRFATIKNNPTITSYTAAWAARASLTYDTYAVAF